MGELRTWSPLAEFTLQIYLIQVLHAAVKKIYVGHASGQQQSA
jgi:hypothetical protein